MPWVIENGKPVEVEHRTREIKLVEHWVTAKDFSFQRTASPDKIYETLEEAESKATDQ